MLYGGSWSKIAKLVEVIKDTHKDVKIEEKWRVITY
jgi:hypothetical protein